jgi:hypothetical protein
LRNQIFNLADFGNLAACGLFHRDRESAQIGVRH